MRALAQLAEHGVSVSYVGTDRVAPTGQVHVHFEDGEPRFTIGVHAAWDHIQLPSLEVFAQSDVICLSTLAQRTPLFRKQLQEKLRTLRNVDSSRPYGGVPTKRPVIIVDLNLRAPFAEPETVISALGCADVLKLNEQELRWVKEQSGAADPIDWLLSRFNLSLVALTKGADGAELRGHNVHVKESGIPVSGGDAVGAGDSFVARLAVAFCQGLSLPAALHEANRYGAWVASQHGAMPRPRAHSP
jgi:fructokinase